MFSITDYFLKIQIKNEKLLRRLDILNILLITLDTYFLKGGSKMSCELLITLALGLARAPELPFFTLMPSK